ncbi:MAG: ATPase domain-containing protein [Candidatus Ranarchaeia archaeon]
MYKRVKTGIPGLDGILHGGFIQGHNILVSGSAGTGKTILSTQFLYKGAKKYNESGVLVTLEERPKELRAEASQFGWDIPELEKKGKLIIIDAASSKAGLPTDEKYALRRGFDINLLAQEIYRASKEIDASRVVIDSISGLGVRFEDTSAVRNAIFKLSSLLRELKCTSLMTSEIPNSGSYSRYGIEEFIAQGLVILYLTEEEGELKRTLIVRKMRGTSHSLKRFPFEISSRGTVVMPGGEI